MSHCGHCYDAARSSGASRRYAEAVCRELDAWDSDDMVRCGRGRHPTVCALLSQLVRSRIERRPD